MLRYASPAAIFAVMTLSTALGAATPTEIVNRHIVGAKKADVGAIVADYADDAVLVTPPGMASPSGIYTGKRQIRGFFQWLGNSTNLPAVKTMVATLRLAAPDTVFMQWAQFPGTAKQVKGSDVFVIRGNKIVFQAVHPAP